MVAIHSRDVWASHQITHSLPWSFGKRYAVLHWTWIPDLDQWANAGSPQTLRSVESYHVSKGGYAIFYNFLVDDDGHIWEGRGWNMRGGAQGVSSSDAQDLSIAWIGGRPADGDVDNPEPPSPAAKDAMNRLLAEARVRGWNAGVMGHKDFKTKPCPGKDWYAWLQDWESEDMRMGDTGKDVEKLQEFINRWIVAYGIGLDPIASDGEFGPITDTYVKSFQAWADLGADGVVDPITISSLITVVKVKEAND